MTALSPSAPDTPFRSAAGFAKAIRPILPVLRGYARRLTGNSPDSDDLVQDTLTRAWRARERFVPGTNLKAWMVRIERNSFLSGRRRANRQVDVDPEVFANLSEAPAQEEALHFADLHRAIDALPEGQRQAFLSASTGDPYEAVAEQFGIAEGTVRSRVFRARAAIIASLESGDRGATIQELPREPGAKASSRYDEWKRSGSRMIG